MICSFVLSMAMVCTSRISGLAHTYWIQLHFNQIFNWLLLLLLSHFSHVWLCVTPETAATRIPHPWDSPGKNTGVGCHFLLQCRKVKSESEVAQSCPTLHDPMDCSPPGSSVHGIFQARVLEWGAIGKLKFNEYWSSLSWLRALTLALDLKKDLGKSWTKRWEVMKRGPSLSFSRLYPLKASTQGERSQMGTDWIHLGSPLEWIRQTVSINQFIPR